MKNKMILILRVAMGWILFQGGIVKVLDSEWTAKGYLLNAVPESNPLIPMWTSLAGSPIIDILVAWGLTLAGLGLIFGFLTKYAAYGGILMMLFFWASTLTGGLSTGFALEHGWFVDDHVIYSLVLFYLTLVNANESLSLDVYLSKRK